MSVKKIGEISLAHVDQEVIVIGTAFWIQEHKSCGFVHLRDGYLYQDKIQVIFPAVIMKFETEAYIKVTGLVRKLPGKAKSFKSVEIHATSCEVLGPSSAEVTAICPPDASIDVRIDQRPIYMRTDEGFTLKTVLRAHSIKAARRAFESLHATEVVPPMFVGSLCESGASLFEIEHPSSGSTPMKGYLTQSSQLYLEMCVPAMGATYCIAPSFRAEKSRTRRHLTEFMHLEGEWPCILEFSQHLDLLRNFLILFLTYFIEYSEPIFDRYQTVCKLDLRTRCTKLLHMVRDAIELTHADAIKKLREFDIRDEKGEFYGPDDDIPEAAERALIDRIDKVVFLTKFPKKHKSFYMLEDPADPTRVLGCDVEVPGVGEIIGSGMRVYKHDVLVERLLADKLKPEDYKEYIELRKYGSCRTAGFGAGLDRILTWILDLHSIREIVTFPRYPGRLTP
jgi:asparaginyl-tRNA synthetase